MVAPLGQAFDETASDLSSRSGDEDLHVPEGRSRSHARIGRNGQAHRCACAILAHTFRIHPMPARAAKPDRIAPRASAASAVAALFVYECPRDMERVAIPRPEIQLVARFGPSARSGLDVHALGGRQTAHRKLIRRGQRAVTARLHLGASDAVLGVPASAIAGRIVALDELWGEAVTGRLLDRLAGARDTVDAAAI